MPRRRRKAPPAGEPLTIRYTQNRLCDYCGDFILRVIQASNKEPKNQSTPIEDYYIVRGHPSDRKMEAVIFNAEQGCWICNHITSNTQSDNEHVKANIRLQSYSFSLDEFDVRLLGSKKLRYYEKFQITSLEGDISTWSFNGLEKAKEWVQKCNEQHAECRGARLRFCTNSYPLRLLDVSSITAGSLKLVEGPSLPPNTQYASLSHCWGQVRQSVLLRSRLDAYSQHISVESLPRTLREAAEICADLELNYLWIDSLCIVQDDLTEWAVEAPRMAEIYTNSYVTLAATASQSDEGGLKRPLNLCHALPLAFSTVDTSGELHNFRVQKDGNFQKYVKKAPLNERAWVLQERSLSSRILYFANDQIYWQCPSVVEAQFELIYDDFDEDRRQHWRMIMKWTSSETDIEREEVSGDEVEQLNRSEEPSEVTILDRWDNLVTEYSKGSLPFNSDKLIAMSGLARRMHDLTPWSESDYLAGLWRQGLPRSLLWKTYRRSVGKPNDVPSWSWASVNTNISYPLTMGAYRDDRSQSLVRIIAATTIPTNDNFGSVVNGKIRLSGSLGKVKVHVWQDSVQEVRTFVRGQGRSWKRIKMKASFDHGDRWTEFFGRTIFLLPVLGRTRYRWFGLMLEPTTIKAGQYRRVGFFSVRANDEDFVRVKDALAVSNLGRKFYMERNGVDSYVIEIV